MYLAYLPHKQSESVKQRYEEYMTRQLSILLQKSNGDFTKVWKSEAFQVFLDTFLQYFPRHFERKYTSEPLDICDYVFQIISRCMKLGLSLTTPQWLDICSIYPENPLPLAPKAAQNVQQELIEVRSLLYRRQRLTSYRHLKRSQLKSALWRRQKKLKTLSDFYST